MGDVLTAVLALATVALAIYTAQMMKATRTVAERTADLAKETKDLARETLAGSILADRHHQESMTPCVVLASGYVVAGDYRLGLQDVTLANVGPGIALNVRVWIGELGEPAEVGSIAANGSLRDVRCEALTTNQPRPGDGVKVVLIYNNLFREEARTIHFGRINRWEFTMQFEPPPIASRLNALVP